MPNRDRNLESLVQDEEEPHVQHDKIDTKSLTRWSGTRKLSCHSGKWPAMDGRLTSPHVVITDRSRTISGASVASMSKQ